jgi:RimJ/RimL family protein N-acetyltransferase
VPALIVAGAGGAPSAGALRRRRRGAPFHGIRFRAVNRRFDRIQTERLILRRWLPSDRAPFAAMNADPEVMRYLVAPLDRETSDAFADRIDARLERQGFGLWALERRDTGEFIGFTGLNPMPEGTPGAGGQEVGWRLAASAWHQGYATEAAKAAVDVAFNGLGLPEIWSITAIVNEPSKAVMRRIGMTEHSFFDHPNVPLTSHVLAHVAYWRPNPAAA